MSDDPFYSSIRITKEEASSAHVDDLLKRQMSMRGEPGVTRDRRRKWYFQNWLVLSLAGAVGAVIAWAILEPFFDDKIYAQGTVQNLQVDGGAETRIRVGSDRVMELRHGIVGSFDLNGEKIHVLDSALEFTDGGKKKHFDLSTIKNGDLIGAHVEFVSGPQTDLALAEFIERAPKASAGNARLSLRELSTRSSAAGLFIFALVASFVGLFVGAVDGIVCRLPRRALLSGAVGLVVGFIGGFICTFLANLVYGLLSGIAMKQATGSDHLGGVAFFLQMLGRSLAWALAGIAMGLGQGIALRSGRLLLYGLLGGILGGLFGGMLFDPIDLILLGPDKPSAHWSRLVGFLVIGASVGGMIGLVELLARDAWLRMTQGPLTGKEFLLFKDVMTIGSSPRSDLYLFNDPAVVKQHAIIRAVGDECEIEARESTAPVLLNNRPIQRSRLRHGDNVTIGRATFVFQRRKS